ncbi:hypothetical protein DY000_02009150 [Brassica cretica]|uniref:Cytochrome P450 n=2 Tax=Brassica cretica TaxID=69181 RepID=A0ABQ7CEW2_BRACR|nr:hypothetical protein DY000_02009150 [Brassica cretica]
MLPALVLWSRRIDVLIRVLEKSNLTLLFKGPWLARMDALITVDPANIHHILSSNFSNYIKGPEFKEMVDVFGDPLFTADGDLWKNIRMSSQVILSRQGFQKEGTVVDLQDVFRRFMFDISLLLVSGSDPQSLSIEMPEVELAEAFDNAGEAIVSRLIIPRFLWKLQNRLRLGKEKKLIEAGATFDRVCAKYIAAKREEIRSQGIHHHDHDGESEDFLTYYIKLDTSKYELLDPSDDKFLRDTILAIIMAIRDTSSSALTWFFWLLSKNPHVEAKIRQEIITNLPKTATSQERPWSATDRREFLNKLVYLHGALYETMRLYPPLPFQRKTSIKSDVLPSGHIVDANSNVIFLVYALGRMGSVWGEDALEFKPERWVSETGELRHEPSSKFLVFNTGPRTCSGKHLAMTSMKTIVVEILQHYDIKLVEGHKIKPKAHLNLLMKHGLRVTLTKRCSA